MSILIERLENNLVSISGPNQRAGLAFNDYVMHSNIVLDNLVHNFSLRCEQASVSHR